MSDREDIDFAFGDPAYAGTPTEAHSLGLKECPRCGHELKPNALSCQDCGENVNDRSKWAR